MDISKMLTYLINEYEEAIKVKRKRPMTRALYKTFLWSLRYEEKRRISD